MDWEGRANLIQVLKSSIAVTSDIGDFFNRKAQLQRLLAILAAPPQAVLVVTGPNDSGKSTLLKHLKKVWACDPELAATSPIFYFDMRTRVWTKPQGAAAHIGGMLWEWKERFGRFVSLVRNGLQTAVTVKMVGMFETALKSVTDHLPGADPIKTDLPTVMEAFAAVTGKVVHPIFILDEAHKLKSWDKTDLTTFSDFFKSLVKQDKEAYLILSTSDDLFREWLRELFNPEQWTAFGVGWFKEDEARKFFAAHSLRHAAVVGTVQPSTVGDTEWQDVYAVCGGSPYLLNRCATTAATHGVSWKDAAAELASNRLLGVDESLSATKASKGFAGVHYESICRKIVETGFVGVKAVLRDIYDGRKNECVEELTAMQAGNHIHIRYMTPTALYEDVSFAEAGGESEIVMACSPAHRAAMKMALA